VESNTQINLLASSIFIRLTEKVKTGMRKIDHLSSIIRVTGEVETSFVTC